MSRYGRIYSQNSAFDGENEIELFLKLANNYVDVRPSNPIPLLRSALAVLMDATLKISTYLWDYDTVTPDDEITKGTVELKPEILKAVSKGFDTPIHRDMAAGIGFKTNSAVGFYGV